MFCFRADQNYLYCTYCIVCILLMSQQVLRFEHFSFWVLGDSLNLAKLLPSVYIQALCQFLIKISFGFFYKKDASPEYLCYKNEFNDDILS